MAVFDTLYGAVADYFGSGPDELLARYCGSLPPGERVLDVGAGQGRNALFLARRGSPVDCIDPSAVAMTQLAHRASKERLPVRVFPLGFEAYSPDVEHYPVILLFGLMQELPRDSIGPLVTKLDSWASPGGLLLVTAFTTLDPEYTESSARTYLAPGELKTLFAGWEPLHYWEGLGSEHRHGEGAPHRHGRVEAVLRHSTPETA
jgi:tellurite methyltransferase